MTHHPVVALLPFTPYQQITRQWESLCPQNAAQVMLVGQVLDPDQVESAWQSTLRDMGLGRVHAERDGYSHEIWSGEPEAPLVEQNSGEGDVLSFVQADLNRPFPEGLAMPYRPFALQRADGCHLGVVYQQWVADSVSIRLIMREWFLRVLHPNKARRKMIDLPRPWMIRGPKLGWGPGKVYRAAKHCWDWARHTRNLRSFAPGDAPSKVDLRRFTIEEEQLNSLLLVTRADGCTLNDLLLAGLADVLGSRIGLSENRAGTLAIATSVDLRPYVSGELSETFASLLAYAPVVCKYPSGNLLDLAQDVARQTRRLKDPEHIAEHLLLPRIFAWWALRQRAGRIKGFYRRHAGICAALANVNLNKSWAAHYYPGTLRSYLRMATPNPAVPISISTSTLGDQLDIVICTHQSTIGPEQSAEISEAFASRLHSLVESRHSRT